VIVLDTNVLSELMRSAPEPAVVGWLDRQPAESVWTTSVTLFEIGFGIELMDAGKRRNALVGLFEELIDAVLERRVLDFDRASARASARIAACLRANGRQGELGDLQIAGIVATRKASLATRNTRHFDGIGLSLIDPWRDR